MTLQLKRQKNNMKGSVRAESGRKGVTGAWVENEGEVSTQSLTSATEKMYIALLNR